MSHRGARHRRSRRPGRQGGRFPRDSAADRAEVHARRAGVGALLLDLHKKLFDTVLVVSDRNVIDTQLQEAIFDFERTTGVVATIKGESSSKSGEKRGPLRSWGSVRARLSSASAATASAIPAHCGGVGSSP